MDLQQMIKQFKIDNFNGIFSKDLLPDALVNGWYIINLENHDEGNGTHWTCLKITNDRMNIYFDSFNFVAPESVDEKIMPYIYNDKQIQDVTSSACGWYCVACMHYMEKHNTIGDYLAFKDFINMFSKNQDYNDGILHRYFSSIS
jgi:hypothetical protein